MTQIEVIDMKLKDAGKIRAFAVVNIGGVIVHDCRVIEGKNGLFVGLPQKQLPARADGSPAKWLPVVSIDDRDLRDEVNDAVVAHYQRVTGAPQDSEGYRQEPITAADIPF